MKKGKPSPASRSSSRHRLLPTETSDSPNRERLTRGPVCLFNPKYPHQARATEEDGDERDEPKAPGGRIDR